MIRCAYQYRSNSSKKDKFTHTYNFTDIRKYGKITQIKQNSEEINNKMFDLVGKSNLSINCVCLVPFRNLDRLQTTYECGQSHPFTKLDDFLPKVSRSTFTNSFILTTNRKQYDKINIFPIGKLASLSVNAGTVNRISYLTIILCNTTLKHIILKNCRHFKGKKL